VFVNSPVFQHNQLYKTYFKMNKDTSDHKSSLLSMDNYRTWSRQTISKIRASHGEFGGFLIAGGIAELQPNTAPLDLFDKEATAVWEIETKLRLEQNLKFNREKYVVYGKIEELISSTSILALRADPEFPEIEAKTDPFGLWQLIKKTHQIPDGIEKAQPLLESIRFNLQQKDDQPLNSYIVESDSKIERLELLKVKPGDERLALQFILGLNANYEREKTNALADGI